MDLPRRLSTWLDSHRTRQEGRAKQDPANRGSLLNMTVSFGGRTMQVAIGRSAKDDGTPLMPDVAEEVPVQDGHASAGRSFPTQAPGAAPSAPMNFYSAPLPVSSYLAEQGQTGPPDSRQQNSARSFWDVLDPTEREALRSVASWRTFAAGARLMEEGERADHVMVILGGQVQVCVADHGSERVLAVRGLGQLVGERGALNVSVRSATVIAVDMVWALVVQTKDFAAFISAHPRVLAIVQSQLYQRGTDEPAGYGYDLGSARDRTADGTADTGQGDHDYRDHDYIAGYSRRHLQPLNGENCTVFLTDVVEFGARTRTDHDRLLIREALFRMTQAAMRSIPDARSEDRGDGFLTVVPPTVSTARVIDQLLTELPRALDLHNSVQREAARFKLRLALNVGPVVSDMGVSGEAIILAARLVEAPHFKEAIAKSTASLGVIASPFVYETAIRHGADPWDVASYVEVPVEVKESDTMAWMKLFHPPVSPPGVRYPTVPDPDPGPLMRPSLSRDLLGRTAAPSGPGFP